MPNDYISEQLSQSNKTSTDPETLNIKKSTDNSNSNGKPHQHRKRKRQYYNAIRNQMEFYFSDANLSKDRFLKNLITVDPFVPLSTFMSFNKIKGMVSSVDDIEKSLENSDFLELSCDKQRVHRITDIRSKDNVDEYTIYVEGLSPNATHVSVRNQFKQFGAIAYVSLPKYRLSGKIKEFAFVEFEQKNSVERCISAFRQFDGVINGSYQPDKIQSVTTYLREQEDYEKYEKNNSADGSDTNDRQTIETLCAGSSTNLEDKQINNSAIESAGNAEQDVTDISDVDSLPSVASQPPPVKRMKLSTDENQSVSDISYEQHTEEGIKNEKNNEVEGNNNREDVEFENESEMQGDQAAKRRRRKRRKAKLLPGDSLQSVDAAQYSHLFDENQIDSLNNSIRLLRVATKTEWKRLRNKYLALQREQYAEIRKIYNQQQPSIKLNQKISTLPPLPRPVIIKSKQYPVQPPSKRICSRNINFYGANDDQNEPNNGGVDDTIGEGNHLATEESINEKKESNRCEKKESPIAAKSPLFEYEPGLIIKIHFDEPCVDIGDFKAEMKQYSFVRYVDLKEGQTAAYVRVDSSNSAPNLIKSCAPRRCQILVGEAETEYWKKIGKDRDEKLSKTVKTTRKRGRKVNNLLKNITENGSSGLKMAVSHIRFDD